MEVLKTGATYGDFRRICQRQIEMWFRGSSKKTSILLTTLDHEIIPIYRTINDRILVTSLSSSVIIVRTTMEATKPTRKVQTAIPT